MFQKEGRASADAPSREHTGGYCGRGEPQWLQQSKRVGKGKEESGRVPRRWTLEGLFSHNKFSGFFSDHGRKPQSDRKRFMSQQVSPAVC